MNKCFFLISIFIFGAGGAFAGETFLLREASKNFDVRVEVEKCEEDACEGRGTVELLKKNRKTVVQTIRLSNIYLELGENRKPTANLIELYGINNSGIVFDDFNFDGAEDLAIRNGNEGAYGGPSYEIWLFRKTNGKFFRNAALTALASENLGLFEVDKKTKTLETFAKGGCCWHETTRYKIAGNRPVKVYVFTEDAMRGDGKVRLITKTLINGKWRVKTKIFLTKDYYKEQ